MENYINSLFSINHALQNGFKSILDKYKVSNSRLLNEVQQCIPQWGVQATERSCDSKMEGLRPDKFAFEQSARLLRGGMREFRPTDHLYVCTAIKISRRERSLTVPGLRCICHNEIYGKVHLRDDASIAPYEFHFITRLFVSPQKTKECSDVFSLYISAFLFFMILSLYFPPAAYAPPQIPNS